VRPARVSAPGGVVRHNADQTCIRTTVAVRKATSDSTNLCIKQNASSVREKDKVAADGKGSPAADCFCLLLTSPLQGRKGISVERVDSHHFRYDFFKKQYTDPNR
jgi:hypothetical protein